MFSGIHGLASWLAHSKYVRFGGYFYYSGTNKPGFTHPGRRYFNGILAETVEAKMQNWVRSVTIYFFLSSGSLVFFFCFFFSTPKNAISHSWLSVCSPFRTLPTLPFLVKFNKWGISWNRWPCIFWLKLGKQEIPSGQSWSLSSSTHLGTFPWTGRGSGFCLKLYSALGDPGRICMQPHSPLNWVTWDSGRQDCLPVIPGQMGTWAISTARDASCLSCSLFFKMGETKAWNKWMTLPVREKKRQRDQFLVWLQHWPSWNPGPMTWQSNFWYLVKSEWPRVFAPTSITSEQLRDFSAFSMFSLHLFPMIIIQSLSRVWLFTTPWTAARQACLSPTVSWSLSIELMMLSNHLIHCCPLLLLPSIFPSFRVFSKESALWPASGQSIGALPSASVLPMIIQDWFSLGLTGLISLLSKGLSEVFSSTTIQKHQFFGTQPPLWFNSHIYTWLLERPQIWLYGPLSAKWYLCFLIHCLGLS